MSANIAIEYTPVLRQYKAIKEQYKECLLFYRLGDFYELFFDDAVEASKVLDIVLTKRGVDTPMCGVPYHSRDAYLGRLVKLGYKVAICEQLETPDEAKRRGRGSLLKRDVVRIVTPGTLLEDGLLEGRESNYLVCISNLGDKYGIAWMELSTGLFNVRVSKAEDLDSEIQRIEPRELLISEKLRESKEIELILKRHKCTVTSHSGSFFDPEKAKKVLCGVYEVSTVKGFGNFSEVEISACGSLLEYVRMTQRDQLPKLDYPKVCDDKSSMLIDGSALRNLELFCTQSGEKKGSLMFAINRTITHIGSRLMKRYLSFPSTCPHVINSRQDAVGFFVRNRVLCKSVRKVMSGIPDIERILTRIKFFRCSPRDLYMLGQALGAISELVKITQGIDDALVSRLTIELDNHESLARLISDTILESSAVSAKDGGFINPRCDQRLAEMSSIENDSSALIEKLRDKYRVLTGINSLKILCNNVLGYYVEISSNYKIDIDDGCFIHRQSLANSKRYTTTELGELEEKINTARSEIIELELQIFSKLCSKISEEFQSISLAANAVAELDVLAALAELAAENNYVRPVIDDSKEFMVKKGRHPIVEAGTNFIANDCNLSEDQRLYLITGPNMAGKSTFLRQNALIAILAHIGSFVPAEYAHIGIIDKIFSRVGASDNIALGYSTFMVEMSETAAILNQATEKSLVILDEIGRGTGTHDGLSIALAVLEYIHNMIKSRAICATHYHELPKLSASLKSRKCFYMKIEEWEGKIVFLHELVPGVSDKSYGIHVAELAGFPRGAIERARFFMNKLDKNSKEIAE